MITLDTPLVIVNLRFIKHNKSTPDGQSMTRICGAGVPARRAGLPELLNQSIEPSLVNHVIQLHSIGKEFFTPLPEQLSFPLYRSVRNLIAQDQCAD
jgi:hypothetical protein